MRLVLFAAAAALSFGAASFASAEVVHFTAKLDGAQETPPHAVKATGRAVVDLDTAAKTIKWKITYTGLTGPATMAHFHGPAAPGKSAGPALPITGDLASPIHGDGPVTDGQIGDLRAGLWYVNIHTAKYPGGEIRGQVLKAH
ncbi:MAG: CHRD domain-containing protein [Caulobacteraceae bacterium]